MGSLEEHIRNIGRDTRRQINLIEREIGGGRISKETIDTLAKEDNKDVLSVSGLVQDTFEYLITRHGTKFRVINFWKNPLVEDFSALESLRDVEYISYFWNQRVTKLWNFGKNPSLKGFSFDDFTRLHDLSDLNRATSLHELEFGDKVWVKLQVNSLAPLSSLSSLQRLSFTAKKITDGRIDPIADLKTLKELSFSPRLFTTEQVAWLKAKLPKTIECKFLAPYWSIQEPIQMSGKRKDTFIVGRKKPFLDSKLDRAKIERYVKEFDLRVNWFEAHPEARPEDFT